MRLQISKMMGQKEKYHSCVPSALSATHMHAFHSSVAFPCTNQRLSDARHEAEFGVHFFPCAIICVPRCHISVSAAAHSGSPRCLRNHNKTMHFVCGCTTWFDEGFSISRKYTKCVRSGMEAPVRGSRKPRRRYEASSSVVLCLLESVQIVQAVWHRKNLLWSPGGF